MKRDGFRGTKEEAMQEYAKRAKPLVRILACRHDHCALKQQVVASQTERALQREQLHGAPERDHPSTYSTSSLRRDVYDLRQGVNTPNCTGF